MADPHPPFPDCSDSHEPGEKKEYAEEGDEIVV
jgi:hypothetical protein